MALRRLYVSPSSHINFDSKSVDFICYKNEIKGDKSWNKQLAKQPMTKRKKKRIERNSTDGRHRFRCFSCFFLGGAYLFSFGILLIRWWCLSGFFTKAHIIWNCFPGKKWLKELLKLDDSSPSVLICCLRSFASSCCFSSGEDVTLRFYSEWSVISSAGEKSSTTSSN